MNKSKLLELLVLDDTEIEALDQGDTVAEQLGYEGALTVPGLEEEIRFYQRRSVEVVLELGKRLYWPCGRDTVTFSRP